MNITETKELAAAIASAIADTNRPAAPVSSETVTVGYNSDPELDKKLFCAGCLRGEPFYPGERPKFIGGIGGAGFERDERGHVLREDGGVIYQQGADGAPTGARQPVRKVISYDLESARALVAKGDLKQCVHCGQVKNQAVAHDGRRA